MAKGQDGWSKYAKYSGLGVQMGVIIAFFCWLGVYLDGKKGPDHVLYTVLFSLLGVGIALYLVIREVIRMSKEDDEK